MVYLLYTIFFISCVLLIATVLLQPGKTDAGALFTSNVSSNAFGPRGTQTILSKITIVAAIVFMVSALMLSMPALTGNVSVLQTSGDAPTETAPAVTTDANTNLSTNANSNPNVPANTAPSNVILITNNNGTEVKEVNSDAANANPANANSAANNQ